MQENRLQTDRRQEVPVSFLIGTIIQWLMGLLWGVLATVFYVKMRGDLAVNDVPMYEKHRKNWKTCLYIAIIVQIVAIIICCVYTMQQ